MRRRECEYEPQIVRAVCDDCWDETLAQHVKTCDLCQEVLAAVSYVRQRMPARPAPVPDADQARQLWRIAHPVRCAAPEWTPARLLEVTRWIAMLAIAAGALIAFSMNAQTVNWPGMGKELSDLCYRAAALLSAHTGVFVMLLLALTAASATVAFREESSR